MGHSLVKGQEQTGGIIDSERHFSGLFISKKIFLDISFMSGVGITVQGWSTTEKLSEIDVNIKSKAECDHSYEVVSKDYYDYYLPEKYKKIQFCAGSVDNNVR